MNCCGSQSTALGGYGGLNTLLRFNGAAGFTLAEVDKIGKFFLQSFGRGMPMSALGQTATHERMKFDHRNAIDVALHPESAEGKSVLNYLASGGYSIYCISRRGRRFRHWG